MTAHGKLKSITEALDSLTGYDEAAIEEKFGSDVYELSFIKRVRALVFVEKRRADDVTDQQAFEAAMNMRSADAVEAFEPDEDDELGQLDDGLVDHDDLSAAGKGDTSSD